MATHFGEFAESHCMKWEALCAKPHSALRDHATTLHLKHFKLQSCTVQSRVAALHRSLIPTHLTGVWFLLLGHLFFVGPPEHDRTGITLQDCNRATQYIKIVLVQGRVAEVWALSYGHKNCKRTVLQHNLLDTYYTDRDWSLMLHRGR